MTIQEEVNAMIQSRLESLDRGPRLREILPLHDPLQLRPEVLSGDTSPLDDILRRFNLHGFGLSGAF